VSEHVWLRFKSRSVHSLGSFPTDVSFAALTRLPVGAFLPNERVERPQYAWLFSASVQ
jgi:hypothetical protein